MASRKKPSLKKLVIQRKRWMRGKGTGALLWEHDNTMCCLGFAARACGYAPKDIRDKSLPSVLNGCEAKVPQWLLDIEDSASSTNDTSRISDNVRSNRGLARGILDQGWGALARMLEYKLAWSGGQLVKVPAAYSSQTCAVCGVVDAKSRKGEALNCTAFGHRDHADLNAAKILKSRWKPSAQPVESSRRLRTPRRIRKVMAITRELSQDSLQQ